MWRVASESSEEKKEKATVGAPKKVKPPIEKAEYQVQKQIEAIANSTLPEIQQAQLIDYFTGLAQAMNSVEQVADPANPPAPDSVYGKLISLGKSKRALGSILTGGIPSAGEDKPASKPEDKAATPLAPATSDVGV